MFDFDPYVPKTLEYAQTKNGKLRGYKLKDVYTFLNIQYGECKRWESPTPVKPWKGIKNALRFGPRMFPGAASKAGAPVFTPWDSCGIAHEAYDYAEDALNLNVWSTSMDKAAKKPVMVWIHGGGFSTGSAMEMQCHHGANLAAFGDVVVVTLNHRLNAFGFLDMSRFGEKYANSVNVGIEDLILALKWVRDNIEVFGGDPDNVLIFGQSGGGGKVTTLMQTPAAAGLFHKAIIMSGVGTGPRDADFELSRKIVDGLLEKYNTDSIEPLLELTPEELIDSVNEVGEAVIPGGRIDWRGVPNGWYIGDTCDVGVLESSKTIPVMIGTVFSEMPVMRVFNKHEYSKEQQLEIIREAFPGQDVDKLLDMFTKAWPGRELTDAIEMVGNRDYREGSLDFLDVRAREATAPTYAYFFAHEFPQQGGRNAWHCADIPIVFHNAAEYPENFHDGLMDGLQDAICSSWVNFAHNSDPNNEHLGVNWPAYKTGECATLIFDNTCDVRYDFDRELVRYRNRMKLNATDKYAKFELIIN